MKLNWLIGILIITILSSCNKVQKDNNAKLLTYLQKEDYEGGMAYANVIEKEMDGNAKFLFYKGVLEYQSGNYQIALEKFDAAQNAKVQPEFFLISYKARAYVKLGMPKLAVSELKKLKKNGKGMYTFFTNPDFEPLDKNVEFQLLKHQLKPSINTWTSFFIFVVLQAIIVGFILLKTPNAQTDANKLLAILVFFFAFCITSYIFYWSGYFRDFPHLNHYPNLMAFIAGPLFFLYVRNLSQNREFTQKDWRHFIPALIAFIAIMPYVLSNYFNDLPIQYVTPYTSIVLHAIIKVLVLFIYGFFSWKLIKKIPKKDENVKHWLSLLFYCYIGFVIAFASYYILVQFDFFNPNWDYMISLMQAVFVFVVGFLGYLQPRILQGETVQEVIQPPKYDKIGLEEQKEKDLAKKIEQAMVEDNLYLENDLNLNTLADYVESNRHHVSMVINKHFGLNFNDFVNRYRVERLKTTLIKPENQEYTLHYLAIESGFNNKVSFNKAFKKFTGMTPSEYIKKQKKESVK